MYVRMNKDTDEIKTFPKDVRVLLVVLSDEHNIRCIEAVGANPLATIISHLVKEGSKDLTLEQVQLVDPQGNDVYALTREYLNAFIEVSKELGSWDYTQTTVLPSLSDTDRLKLVVIQ